MPLPLAVREILDSGGDFKYENDDFGLWVNGSEWRLELRLDFCVDHWRNGGGSTVLGGSRRGEMKAMCCCRLELVVTKRWTGLCSNSFIK
ncbi:hypothetical protein NC652_027842 [Populus alba x Populus x berolinensis]|nr:hypothetical protein NC652_027842 [Populus alba x Populus x berolinensis]